jgi:hypothetical protein
MMNTKKITFLNAQGEQLAARLELPEDEQPLAYALFAHCFTCSKDLKAVVNISRALSSQRIAVLRFDFTGLGESEGAFPRRVSAGRPWCLHRNDASGVCNAARGGRWRFTASWTRRNVSACWRLPDDARCTAH